MCGGQGEDKEPETDQGVSDNKGETPGEVVSQKPREGRSDWLCLRLLRNQARWRHSSVHLSDMGIRTQGWTCGSLPKTTPTLPLSVEV